MENRIKRNQIIQGRLTWLSSQINNPHNLYPYQIEQLRYEFNNLAGIKIY